jgi:energy-coupling factor transporter ATP-binding protein EcfA2
MRDLTAALDLLDLAIASSEGLAGEPEREHAAAVASAARRRQDYFSGSILVAIAGGTGSGKSSLLNAIAGSMVAGTSALRPHTAEPLAWIPGNDRAIAAMVADLGITEVVAQQDDSMLAIIDLPDLDSVDGRHRTLVESVLPHVDAVLWVFDPVKYHDPSIHADFLTHVTDYESVFTFVLNKIDRIDEAEAEAVATHLGGILAMDGFADPQIVAVAADPTDGEPIGIESLVAVLGDTLVAKRADRAKLIEDLLGAGRGLASQTSSWIGTADDANERIRAALDDADRLSGVLDDLGIEGPLRHRVATAGAGGEAIDHALLQRAELAATVAALGVVCAEISSDDPGGVL